MHLTKELNIFESYWNGVYIRNVPPKLHFKHVKKNPHFGPFGSFHIAFLVGGFNPFEKY